MTNNDEKLEQLRIDMARSEGKIDTLTQMVSVYHSQLKTLEGRFWGLAVMALGALGTAVLSLVTK